MTEEMNENEEFETVEVEEEIIEDTGASEASTLTDAELDQVADTAIAALKDIL